MKENLKILLVASEMAPFAKTGGLADVVGALARYLKLRGHDVRVVLPYYQAIGSNGFDVQSCFESLCVQMGTGEEWCRILRHETSEGVPVLFVEHHLYFNRYGFYNDEWMTDYSDNPRRFGFFCRAALQYCMDANFSPDVVHVNDWQTALVPAYLKTWFWNHPALGSAASAMTIHNVAYQGVYNRSHFDYLGLGAENFTAEKFEAYGAMNFLKGGIWFSDAINTVSPGFARDITTPHQGFGLAPYLSQKGDSFYGILNGVDYTEWNPETDSRLPATYGVENMAGKQTCKRALQKAFHLEERNDVCIIATIGRFAEQKGFWMLRDAIEGVLDDMLVQFVILGSGQADLADYYGSLPARYPGRAGSFIGYNEDMAHLIEAGADFFLMPSRFEPCGLNQMYSLRYGTLPIVHATGGLDDTVEQYNEATGEGTGFKFWNPSVSTLYNTVGWAVSTYYDRPHHVRQMVAHAMQRDFSWEHAVVEYEKFYALAMENKALQDKA